MLKWFRWGAYRSEEDNDPLTDDGASTVSIPLSRNQHIPSSPLTQARASSVTSAAPGTNIAVSGRAQAVRARYNHLSDVASSDDGSPTYDGDIESTTTGRNAAHYQYANSSRPSGLMQGVNSSTSTLTSPTTSTFPTSVTAAATAHGTTTNPTLLGGQLRSVNANAVPLQVSEEPQPAHTASSEFDPSKLTTEDIRAFVDKAIAGDLDRPYKINQAPVGRPIRIYADGMSTNDNVFKLLAKRLISNRCL